MQFHETPESRLFREEVRDWLQTNRPHERRPRDPAEQKLYDRAWQRAQYEGGWAGISWPTEFGGRGLSPSQQLVWCEEYARAHCPAVHDSCWLGQNHAGPTLYARASPEQKAFHLPRILRGDATWCQGFSEPNAGSDLASLRTRGVVDGDDLVINGQKIWTTMAHLADYQELLIRTGPEGGRHKGLTWIICDMHLPGVEVRPIVALDGELHTSEVFYDNVRIPLSSIVGGLDEGWSVALTTLAFERGPASFGALYEVATKLEDLIGQIRDSQATAPAELRAGGELAMRISFARAEVFSVHALACRMIASAEHGMAIGNEGSILRLAMTEVEQTIMRLAIEVLGPAALSHKSAGEWPMDYFSSFAETIAGGTSEIQRNIIGERMLGLPR